MVTIQCGDRPFRGIQAVVFDKDGTLADCRGYLTQLARLRAQHVEQLDEAQRSVSTSGVLEALLQTYGLDGDQLNPAGLMAVGSRSENLIATAAVLAARGLDWITARAIAHQAFEAADSAPVVSAKAAATPLFAGCQALLHRLRGAGLPLVLLSSDSGENVQEFVRYYDLGPQFQGCQGAHSMLCKPDPALVLAIVAQLGVAPAAVLVIGDSAADWAMARAAGSRALGVTWGWAEGLLTPKIPDDVDAIAQVPEEIWVVPEKATQNFT